MRLVYLLATYTTRGGLSGNRSEPSTDQGGIELKTDRHDVEKLARCYRAGELMVVWAPDAAHEALRDLVRTREAAKKDQLKSRHRLGKFLLRHGWRPEGMKAWTKQHLEWIKTHVHFDQPALEATLLDYLHQVEHVATRIVTMRGPFVGRQRE